MSRLSRSVLRCVEGIRSVHPSLQRGVGFLVRQPGSSAETLHICKDILSCQTIDELAAHYRRYQLSYDSINHLAALNRFAQLDVSRSAGAVCIPHMIVLEKFLAPVVSQLAPREILSFLYVAALYARPIPVSARGMLEAAVVRQLRTVQAQNMFPVWSSPRRGDEQGLTRVPQECFAAIRGRDGDLLPQDAANALWAATKVQFTARSIFDSMWSEMNDSLRSSVGAPSLTLDSLLRTLWAAARTGCDRKDVRDALADALATQRDLTFAQQVLVGWAFVTLHHEHHPFAAKVVRGVLDPENLEAARFSVAPSAQLQLIQLHTLLHARAASGRHALPPALPAWLSLSRSPAPIEANLRHAAALSSISAILRSLRVKHVQRFVVDGFSIDVAFPAKRVGIEVAISRTTRSTRGRSSWRGQPRLSDALPPQNRDVSTPATSEVDASHASIEANAAKFAYLKAKGWTVLTVELSAWSHLGDIARERMLSEILSAAGV
jgi:hypothetical protein